MLQAFGVLQGKRLSPEQAFRVWMQYLLISLVCVVYVVTQRHETYSPCNTPPPSPCGAPNRWTRHWLVTPITMPTVTTCLPTMLKRRTRCVQCDDMRSQYETRNDSATPSLSSHQIEDLVYIRNQYVTSSQAWPKEVKQSLNVRAACSAACLGCGFRG